MRRYTRSGNTDNDRQTQQQHKVSVSLGKASLRLRLEAYYTVVAPDQIAETTAWRSRYDQIWEKFGGSEAGEKKLATKLAKKYGTAIRLQLTTTTTADDANGNGGGNSHTAASASINKHMSLPQNDEAWFELNDKERSSGDLCFTSASFDPVATLLAPRQAVVSANKDWMDNTNTATTTSSSMLLDRVQQFRQYLPHTDPQFQETTSRKRSKTATTAEETEAKKKMKPLGSFTAIASHHETGPLSVLHKAFVQRDRVRVLIRYVNGIRGTLTGTLIAFDKHFNLILRDVEEVYSRRQITNDDDLDSTNDNDNRLSNAEMEVQRRLQGLASFRDKRDLRSRDSDGGGKSCSNAPPDPTATTTSWSCRQRSMRQIMVRGDNVVSVYRADMERSAWPVTSKSPKETMYRKQSVKKLQVPREEKVGTPGSLIYAASVAKRRHQQQQQQAKTMGPHAAGATGRKHDYRS